MCMCHNSVKDSFPEIYKAYMIHENQFGSRAAIEDVIVSKRRFQYEEVRWCVCCSFIKK